MNAKPSAQGNICPIASHFVHPKSNMDYAGKEPEIQRLESGIYPPDATNRGPFISLSTFYLLLFTQKLLQF